MNRPGQPPQRPPSLGPTSGLGGAAYRGPPYPAYGLPPRNVLQGAYVPTLQQPTHRTTTGGIVPQPSPGFMQQRGSSSFAFGGGLGQAQTPGQQHQASALQVHSNSLQQAQQQSNGGTAPSVSSASEVGLDPNDFPALGSTAPTSSNATTVNGSSSGNTGGLASYASQAGTGGPLGVSTPGVAGVGNATQPRDFTPDDFPALGQHQSAQQTSQPGQDTSQPPGLNGFAYNDHTQQHRQNLLGSLSSNTTLQSNTPGMLNLSAAQARTMQAGFQQGQSEAEKQRSNYALKLNQASHAAWNSPNANVGSTASAFANPPSSTQPNGTHQTQLQNHAPGPIPPANPSTSQSQTQQPSQPSHLGAPPGVAPPGGSFSQLGQSGQQPPGATFASNGHDLSANSTHPQTPAQQVLMSAADRWGLLGLLQLIKNASQDLDGGLSSVGTDLGTMGLDIAYPGNLYSTFITPWADQSAAHTVEPDFHLPACYNVQPPPPGPNKAAAFSDETLFFMFYSSPRDALQEVAAQELWNRNWRFHKELRLWITKETGTTPSQKIPGGESGTYTYWDPENWIKERKEMTVLYADLEEKSVPVFAQGPGLVLAQNGGQATQQQQVQQAPVGQSQPAQTQHLQQTQRGAFQMAMAGL